MLTESQFKTALRAIKEDSYDSLIKNPYQDEYEKSSAYERASIELSKNNHDYAVAEKIAYHVDNFEMAKQIAASHAEMATDNMEWFEEMTYLEDIDQIQRHAEQLLRHIEKIKDEP